MVKITIDGKQYEVDQNTTIIQAARRNGIKIPHFCWHPELSVSGNCRVCLVEVEKTPKLVIACATQVAEGMVVHTNSERVIKARNAVLEFILINHPLDCPICDEAGECKLQDYAYKYSVGESRFEFEKVRKPKRVSLGPNVMLDVERCIMCSRCIRFCDEIAKKPQLVFTKRGDHVELTTYPGVQLDNPYSMNVVDICPVGALTSRSFRFRARVWDMSSTDSICVGCSRGCNTQIWVRNNEIMRLTPRFNADVNNYWMCDHGRLNTFKHVNAVTRIKAPKVRKDGILEEVGWEEAISKVASEIKSYKKHEIAAIGSAFGTNEDNFMLVKLMNYLGIKRVHCLTHRKPGDGDDILIQEDKTPNYRGVKEVGAAQDSAEMNLALLIEMLQAGKIKFLYVLDDDIASDPVMADAISKIECLIVHASIENETTKRADVVLACSTYAERNGTMINFQGRVQRIRTAVTTLEKDRALDGLAMSRLDRFGAHNDRWTKGMQCDSRASWRITCGIANALGAKWRYSLAEDVFQEISAAIPAFKGLSYAKIGTNGVNISQKKESVSMKE
jgi:NADH-quinone oxidoreductase subunit G